MSKAKDYYSNPSKSRDLVFYDRSNSVSSQYTSSKPVVKNEIQEIKRKAKEANEKMLRRKRAAIKIQKMWRGYCVRKNFRKMKRKLMEEKKEYMKKHKRREYITKNAPKIICAAIYKYVLKKRSREKAMLKKYLHHCATIIQKNVKGYFIRAKYALALEQMRQFQDILWAFVGGWKLRKIWKHRSVKRVILEIKELEQFEEELDHEEHTDSKKMRREFRDKIRKKKLQLRDMINRMFKSGTWMYPHTGLSSPRRDNNSKANNKKKYNNYYNNREEEDNQSQNVSLVDSFNPDESRNHRETHSKNYGDASFDRGYEDEQIENEIEEEAPVSFRASMRGSQKRSFYEEERPIKPMKNANPWDEQPIGGSKTGNPMDERPISRNEANAYDMKENRPVGGGKGAYAIPTEEGQEPEEGGDEEKKASPKKKFLTRKQKYDPRKAIEEAKNKDDVVEVVSSKNKKSEDFRNALKAARGWQSKESNEEERVPKKKSQPQSDDNFEIKEQPGEEESAEKKRGGHKPFLKRKSKAMPAQKLNWNVGSRIDSWQKRDLDTSRSPERIERPKSRAPVRKGNKSDEDHPSRPVSKAEESKKREFKSPPKRDKSSIKGDKSQPKKKLKSPGAQQLPSNVRMEDLEKAYTSNFLNKYNNITLKFYSEDGARDPKYEYNSIVPILRLNCDFFAQYDPKNYQAMLNEMEKEYQSLQSIS